MNIAQYACLGCREAKRKCDRVTPECTLCQLKDIPCVYVRRKKRSTFRSKPSNGLNSPPQIPQLPNTPSPSQASSTQSTHILEAYVGEIQQQNIVAEHFLDPEIFKHSLLQLPALQIDSVLTNEISSAVGSIRDIQTTAQRYFATVHIWMPIVSKIQFSGMLLRRLTHNRAEVHLLILAMRLSSDIVSSPRSELYEMTKWYQHNVENSGILSLLVLQANVLITCYEFGHGIYPAAFLSIARCARYAAALAVDSTITDNVEPKAQGLDQEECRRVWWAILALDRFMSLPDPKRRLVTPDPDSTSYIPNDDRKWDDGTAVLKSAHRLNTADDLELGRFARLCQTAHLLSLVIRAIAEGSDEVAQLRRTLYALVNVSKLEADTRGIEPCTQLVATYGAILVLENPNPFQNGSPPPWPFYGDDALSLESSSVLDALIKSAEKISRLYDCFGDKLSPFILFVSYKAASIFLERAFVENTDGDAVYHLAMLKNFLKLLSGRWLVADAYLSLLERRQTLLELHQFVPSDIDMSLQAVI